MMKDRTMFYFAITIAESVGYKEAYCWQGQSDEANKASFVEKTEEDSKLFMVICSETEKPNNTWFLGSGCSNHMSGRRSSFKEPNESKN